MPLHAYQKIEDQTRRKSAKEASPATQGQYVGETLFVRQTSNVMRLTKLLLITLSAIRRDRAAAAGVIMKKLGPPLGSTALLGCCCLNCN